MERTLILATMLALAACTPKSGTFCDIAKPLRVTEQTIAAMSDAEVEAALAHNEKGRALCGWQP